MIAYELMAVETRAGARGPRSVAKAGLAEVAAVWVIFAAVGASVFVTYARIAPPDLYHVSGEGLAGGASRTLVYLNYPVALVAIALVLLSFDRLPTGLARAAAAVSIALCAVVAVPGVVDQANLDARPVNVAPAVGVALALALTAAAIRTAGANFAPRQVGDVVRAAVAAALLVLAAPWLAADLGFYLGGPFMGSEIPPGENLAAVHLGHHHGLDGALFALSALLLSRTLATVRGHRLRALLGLYLALMLVYGVANAAQDAWLEQLVKRGWVDWAIPSMVEPRPTPAWGLIVLGTLAVWAAGFRRLRPAG